MNGSQFTVLDTNVVLYHLNNRLKQPLQQRQYTVSVITEIELLSYPKITLEETKQIQEFISSITVIDLTDSIKTETIKLRKKYGIKAPDAIIAATALRLGAELLTNDKKLSKITEIDTQSVDI